MKQSGRKAASGGNLPAPNCTSESVIDIYSRFAGQGGPRERSTRASKRSASSVRPFFTPIYFLSCFERAYDKLSCGINFIFTHTALK